VTSEDAVVPYVDHVFVDEFQDTNPVQFAIHLHWLTRPHTRLMVVGDDDQALYRFRGSDIACFTGLADRCHADGIGYRQEKLDENWRSTKRIVAFSGAFRDATLLSAVSMPKTIGAPEAAATGDTPRLLQGPWRSVCGHVAGEIDALGAGHRPDEPVVAPSVAVLLFSTSEKEGRRGGTAALDLRRALEDRGLRVYNPRNKTAARRGSPSTRSPRCSPTSSTRWRSPRPGRAAGRRWCGRLATTPTRPTSPRSPRPALPSARRTPPSRRASAGAPPGCGRRASTSPRCSPTSTNCAQTSSQPPRRTSVATARRPG